MKMQGKQLRSTLFLLLTIPFFFYAQEQDDLWEAIDDQDIAAVAKLIQQADVNAQDIMGDPPLLLAIRTGNIPIVQLLLAQPEIDVNQQSEAGATPLTEAIITATNTNNPAILQLLLADERVDVNAPDKFGDTPLIVAIVEATDVHNPAIVPFLLANERINLNAPDAAGNTPLMVAVEQINPTLVNLLIANGADPYIENADGKTALEMTDEIGNKTIIAAIENAIHERQKGTAETLLKTREEINPDIAGLIEEY